MTPDHFRQILTSGTGSYGLSLNDGSLAVLLRYYQELQKWARKVNLVARGTADWELIEKHFLDSLALLQVLDPVADQLVDIGTGAGFPGLVCKAGSPDLNTSLVEPRAKRAAFLRHIIRVCGLTGVVVHEQRLEAGEDIPGEQDFTCLVSRAVSDIAGILAMSRRFCRSGFRVICMKGPAYKQELARARDVREQWHLEQTLFYELPQSGSSRVLLVFSANPGQQ